MFDIGFWELALISMVGLVILGPERLPQTMRLVLSWVQRSKQVTRELSTKLESELGLEQINQELKQGANQVIGSNLNLGSNEVQRSVSVPKIRPRTSRAPETGTTAQESSQKPTLEPMIEKNENTS